MKAFNIKFDGAEASISVCIQSTGGWVKKTLRAYDAEELWDGMRRLLELDSLPEEKKAEAIEFISKAKERESIEIAIPSWLSKGNKIKICPPFGKKLEIEESLKAEILADLGLSLELTSESESIHA
jgi:hypothetical protein